MFNFCCITYLNFNVQRILFSQKKQLRIALSMEPDFSCIKQGEYTIRLQNRLIVVNVIRMSSSLILWIGNPLSPSFQNFAASAKTRLGETSTTSLLSRMNAVTGSAVEVDNNDFSERLSVILSRKFACMVYVSCSLILSEDEESQLVSTLLSRVSEFLG